MKSILIIINGFFPLKRGEDYLENELKYTNYFDDVYICPTNVFSKTNSHQEDSLVGEFKVLILKNRYVDRLLYCIFFALFHSFFWKELFKIVHCHNIKRVFRSFVCSTFKSINIYKEMIDTFKNRKGQITLYSYWMGDTAVAASLLVKYSKLDIKKCVTRCHRFDVYEYANKQNYLPYRTLIFSNMNSIYPISINAFRYLTEKYHIEAKMEIERLGTEDYGFLPVSKTNVLKIVSCSWLRPVKRVGLILKALKMLEFPIEWIHYGDGEEYLKLTKEVQMTNNENLKILFPGRVDNNEIIKLYKEKKFDVFINVSENEGVPVSIMEAMSVGMIVIATNVGGTNEIVKDGVNGYLLPKDCSAREIASKIYDVYKMSDKQYEEARKHSRLIWKNMCSSKDNYIKFYNDLKKYTYDIQS